MKMYQQITLRAFFGLSVVGLLTGCTIFPEAKDAMSKSSTDYNFVVEKAQNEMLLLNIVRASKRRPMYFTSFSTLRGSMSYDIQTGNISIPFGGGSDDKYSIAPSLRYSTNPFFDLTVQDSKEFTCGIMTPVSMETIEYYFKQGWPPYLLLHLFIERIEIKGGDGKPKKEIDNDPEDPNFKEFQDIIQTKKWEIVEASEVNLPRIPIGEIDVNEASKLQTLVEAQKAGLEIKPSKKGNKKEVFSSHIEYVFQGTDLNDSNKVEILRTEFPSKSMAYRRSPEAILYYLGEILRVENRKRDPTDPKTYPYTTKIKNDQCSSGKHPDANLFYASIARADYKAPCVSVDYEGVRYVIPQDPGYNDGCCADRSMSVLTLVSQLIGLQREIKEAPVTGVVSVIGGR